MKIRQTFEAYSERIVFGLVSSPQNKPLLVGID